MRSKREILFEQEISPPDFPIRLDIGNSLAANLTYKPIQETDKRGREAKLTININDMKLTMLQRKRLIFLLGPRYRNSDNFKIVFKNYNELQKNIIKAFEILKLLYIEAKRAPTFHPVKSTPRERRNYYRKYLGKTQEERSIKKKELDQRYENDTKKLEKLWENKEENFTMEKIRERVLNKVKMDEQISFENIEATKNVIKESTLEELPISKKDYEENLVKSRKLTPKAFKLFFEKSDNNQNQIEEN